MSITNLPYEMYIEILLHIPYEFSPFGLVYTNKSLYKLLLNKYIIIKMLKPRVDYLIQSIENCDNSIVIIYNDYYSFIQFIFGNFVNYSIDVRCNKISKIIPLLFIISENKSYNIIEIIKNSEFKVINSKVFISKGDNVLDLSLGYIKHYSIDRYKRYLHIVDKSNTSLNTNEYLVNKVNKINLSMFHDYIKFEYNSVTRSLLTAYGTIFYNFL